MRRAVEVFNRKKQDNLFRVEVSTALRSVGMLTL